MSFSKLLGLRCGRSSVVSDLLGVFLDSSGEWLSDNGLAGDSDLSGFLLLLIEALLVMGALDFLFCCSGSESLLIVGGDVEGLEWIGHRILILKII